MALLRHAVAALLIGACAPVAFAAPAYAQTCACAPEGGYVIQADEAPPPLPEYDQPPIPAPGYYWTPGYWAWNNYDYYWVPGSWVEPPQPGLLWTPGYWAFVGGAYAFRPGYWGPRVGFYGGIDYGFGYGGDGYQGGRWDNGRFFYNTSVNNVGGAHIANVYHQPIVANPTPNRASFNGGPGGMVAKPTSEQLLAEKEPHVRATKLQVNQARDAGMRSEQFVSTNRGKPAVAATERPGQFKGKGVVPARAAGKAAEATPAETKEKPASLEKPLAPGAAPGAPKAEEKHGPAETLGKPEAAPGAAKVEEKHAPAEKLAKPEPLRLLQSPRRGGLRPRSWPSPRPRRTRRRSRSGAQRSRSPPGPKRRTAHRGRSSIHRLSLGAHPLSSHVHPLRPSAGRRSRSAGRRPADGPDCRPAPSESRGEEKSSPRDSRISAAERIRLNRAQCTVIFSWSAAGRSPPG